MIEIIKHAALEAVEASNPSRIYFGTVVNEQPLAINIDQKYTVPQDFLVLSKNVTNYEMIISVTDLETEENKDTQDAKEEKVDKHKHSIKIEKKKVTIHNALKKGETVILLQMQGGQRYIVLDKVGG